MAKPNSIEELIIDLNKLEKNFDKKMQEKYDNIMALIMVAIGKATAYDTGVSRDLVKDIIKELGRDDLTYKLDHNVYEFWNTLSERKQKAGKYTLKKTKNSYHISIDDDGFVTQAEDGKVSEWHPRQDPMVVPRQVDYGIDLMELAADEDIEKAFDELQSFICKAIDGDI